MEFKNAYQWVIFLGQLLQSPLLLLMRIYWGISFFKAGLGKLMDISKTAGFFETLNIPWPTFNAALAGSAEFFGGLLLIVGLASRLISLPLAFVMSVAFATAHSEAIQGVLTDPYQLLSQSPFTYLLCVLVILAFGPGRFSLDWLFGIDRSPRN